MLKCPKTLKKSFIFSKIISKPKKQNPKTPKSQNPKTTKPQKHKNPKTQKPHPIPCGRLREDAAHFGDRRHRPSSAQNKRTLLIYHKTQIHKTLDLIRRLDPPYY